MPETNRRKIIARLERKGWLNRAGKEHDKFVHLEKKGVIIVPRHTDLSPGVARSIAKAAGWR